MDDGIITLEPEALPEDWLARIKPELAPGERLIWAGQGKPGRNISGRAFAMIYAVGFAVVGAFGFAGLYGLFGPRLRVIESALALMGVSGCAIAFLIAIGAVAVFFEKRSERRLLAGYLYALTDSRAITWSPSGKGVTVHSTFRGSVKGVHRFEYADGSGSVLFDNTPVNTYGLGTGFYEIPDARRVEALVRLHLIGDDRTPST